MLLLVLAGALGGAVLGFVLFGPSDDDEKSQASSAAAGRRAGHARTQAAWPWSR